MIAAPTRAELLAPYEPTTDEPWNLLRVRHLYLRAGFGATWDELQDGLARGPAAVLDDFCAGRRREGVPAGVEAVARQLEGAARASSEARRYEAFWFWRMLYGADPLRDRLTLLWHDHFATSNEKISDAAVVWHQIDILHRLARGRFGELLPACIKDPAMLLWLDAASNYREHPNENLARELMELFTLGEGNYTETDVREVARALTGWRITATGEFFVFAEHHDIGSKTILGRNDDFDGDGVLALLLEHPATARRLAWRIASAFVAEPLLTDALIDELASLLQDSGLDLGAAVDRLLRSRSFFCDANLRAMTTPPAVAVTALTRAFECFGPAVATRSLAQWSEAAGQRLLHPPSVFGWPRGEGWFTTSTLLARAKFARALVAGELSVDGTDRPVARLLTRHDVPGDAAAQVAFFGRLLLGEEPRGELREMLLATASEPGERACDEMVVRLCTSVACQLA
ncbi:MAG: DUF1800 domain-containing protein [Planctomycetes bacterium]|nr:DUF1800 domain-containing protein [Planctomycetota bacterium]